MTLLTERQLEVVLAVVYEYIECGEPAGSRTIAKKYLRGCSPATIRNEMSDLEEMGYLYQPHTSAGRLPTPMAYRLYVDAIMQRRRNPHPGVNGWLDDIRDQRRDMESVLAYASQLLGKVTSYVGVAAIAPLEDVAIHRIDFLRLGGETVLMVIVLNGGLVHSRTILLPADISQDMLDNISRSINTIASGNPWGQVREVIYSYLVQELEQIFHSCREAIDQMDLILSSRKYRLFTGGARYILALPDFQDMGKLKAILSLLEEEKNLAAIVEKCSQKEGVRVTIGDENPVPGISSCSVVTVASSTKGQRAVLGLIGPMRMDYERSIALLETMLKGLYEDF